MGELVVCKYKVYDFTVGKIYEIKYSNENWVVLYSKYCAYFFTKEEFKANFYTKSEVRKLKLNKINETNLQ